MALTFHMTKYHVVCCNRQTNYAQYIMKYDFASKIKWMQHWISQWFSWLYMAIKISQDPVIKLFHNQYFFLRLASIRIRKNISSAVNAVGVGKHN